MDAINKEIIKLSIPTILSNVTIPLLGICDTAISGHLGSELFLSSIAVGTVMLNVVFWIFGFLRGGTTGITANALGAGSEAETSKVFYRSLLIAWTAGILLIILRTYIFQGLWVITGGGAEIQGYVENYFKIRIWGSPALLSIIVISGWFVGMQNTFYPMVIAIVTNIINIGASYTLTFVYDYGFAGVAVGTLISNWIGLGISVICIILFLKGKFPRFNLKNIIKGEWWKYFAVNGNLFLRSLFIICVTMGVTAAGARTGNLTLAVNIIVMQFFQFFSFFMDGFAYSGEAMIGLRAGAKEFKGLQRCVRRLLEWTFATGILFSIIYFSGLEYFTSMLTDSDNVVRGVMRLTPWVTLIPIVSCWAFIYDGFYIGVTDTFQMMFSTFIGAIVFFGILVLNLGEGGLVADDRSMEIWTAFLSYLFIRGLYLAVLWRPTLTRKNLRAAYSDK